MNELIEFLTSEEVIVVYIVAAIACFLAFIIYLVDKNYAKRKMKQNTRELNKLVEQVQEVEPTPKDSVTYNEPVLEPIVKEEPIIINTIPTIEKAPNSEVKPTPIVPKEEVKAEIKENIASTIQEPEIIIPKQEEAVENLVLDNLDNMNNIDKMDNVDNTAKEELTYTSIEPNKEEAKEQLNKLASDLEQAQTSNNIELTSYEQEQESNAIISLEELLKKSKEIYQANELNLYKDEGNEPISLADLEKQMHKQQTPAYDEPFIIENVVDEIKPEEITELLDETPSETLDSASKQLRLDDFLTAKTKSVQTTPSSVQTPKEAYQEKKKFQSSPIISPIYGIEKQETTNDIELENTANYDKLDEEIKKTNEFIMTLKELQKNLK